MVASPAPAGRGGPWVRPFHAPPRPRQWRSADSTVISVNTRLASGSSADDAAAAGWYRRAAEQGHAEALKTRNAIGKSLSPAEINHAEERSRAWKPTPP